MNRALGLVVGLLVVSSLAGEGAANAQARLMEASGPERDGSREVMSGVVGPSCTFNGIRLAGRVKVVKAFEDIKVRKVDVFPDLKVKTVTVFPDDCGEWMFVDAFPDFTIRYVDVFPDIKVKDVDVFPGVP